MVRLILSLNTISSVLTNETQDPSSDTNGSIKERPARTTHTAKKKYTNLRLAAYPGLFNYNVNIT